MDGFNQCVIDTRIASIHQIPAAGGRSLRVFDDGDPGGVPVIVQHGTPMSGSLYPPDVEDARARGVRLLGYDRPGYAGSSRAPGRKVVDVAGDVAAIADALGLDRIATWGISGGGPHVLACAARLGERLAAAACLASPAPYEAPGLGWFEGMGQDNVDEFTAALRGPGDLVPYLERQAEALTEAGVDEMIEALRTLLAPVDERVLGTDLGAFLLESSREALAGGVDGWVDDDLAFAAAWGFELEEIDRPVLLWHGEHDRFVPIAHGRWLSERIPGVDARLSADDGHLTLAVTRVPEVHAWLRDRF